MLLLRIKTRNLRFLPPARLLCCNQQFFLFHPELILNYSIFLCICAFALLFALCYSVEVICFSPISSLSLRRSCMAGISVKPLHLPVHLHSNNQLVFIIFLILLILLNRLYGFNTQKSSSTTKIFLFFAKFLY